jgi:lysyl-tRNA synthetase class 2
LEHGGQEAYPVSAPRTHEIAELRALVEGHPSDLGLDDHFGEPVSVSGRVHSIRDFDGLVFVVHVAVTGEVGLSKHGELSVFATSWTMATTSLRPMPDLRNGIADPETRVRQRHLYLIANRRRLR